MHPSTAVIQSGDLPLHRQTPNTQRDSSLTTLRILPRDWVGVCLTVYSGVGRHLLLWSGNDQIAHHSCSLRVASVLGPRQLTAYRLQPGTTGKMVLPRCMHYYLPE